MKTQNAFRQDIQDVCISVAFKGETLTNAREALVETLCSQGFKAEATPTHLHCSLAYGEGAVQPERLDRCLEAISARGFQARATGFEILEGRMTDYDYLALTLESRGDFALAKGICEDHIATKHFEDGFRGHVSLVRLPKGALKGARGQRILRELNACYGLVFALGRCLCLEGECICVFDGRREVCIRVPITSAA